MIEHSGVGYEGFFSSFFFLFPLDIPGARFFCLPLRDKEFSKTLPSNSLVPRPLTLSPFSHSPTLETPQLIYLVEKVNQVEPQGFNVQVSAREKKKKKEREEAAAFFFSSPPPRTTTTHAKKKFFFSSLRLLHYPPPSPA